ncbi:MAG: ABC transporter permease subunit [Chthonomonadetes bacterium]|nr:ABC transporter permease subunit [Chthonomonadetes bacterium]
MTGWRENPLIQRELHYRLRPQPSQRLIILVVVVLCSLAILLFYWAALENIQGPESFRDLLTVTLIIEMVLVVAGAPAVTANAISKEREQRTWDLLTITLLRPKEIVLGKLLGRVLPFLALLALGVPMVILCVLGNPALWLSAVLGMLSVLATLALYSAGGLAASCFSRKTVTATALAYLFAGAWVFGTLILWGLTSLLLPGISDREATVWLTVNPFAVLEPIIEKFSPRSGYHPTSPDMLYTLSPWMLLTVYSVLTVVLVWVLIATYRQWAYR